MPLEAGAPGEEEEVDSWSWTSDPAPTAAGTNPSPDCSGGLFFSSFFSFIHYVTCSDERDLTSV